MPEFIARPTVYNGIQMRSRLEATFAGFLDEVGFEWAYEPRAYGSGRAQYLPDFEIRFGGIDPIYVEVKGPLGTSTELAAIVDRMGIILASEPEARLVLIIAETLARGDFDVAIRDPLHLSEGPRGWRAGRFALCSCGSVNITVVTGGPLGRAAVPLELCGQCDAGSVVAWLDPTSRRA